MAITKTGQAAEEAEKNLAARKIQNPFVTQAETKVTYDPQKYKTGTVFGQKIVAPDYGPSGLKVMDKLSRMNVEITKPGGELVRSSNQSALEAASKALGEQKYQSPEEAAGYMSRLAASLGIKGPADTRDTTRTAAFGQLDKGAYMDALRSAGQLSAQGQERGSRSQALATLRGTELAGSKAQTEAQIQGDYAQQLAAYNQAMLSGAQNQAANQSTFGMQRARDVLGAQQAMTDDEWRRLQASYEAALAQTQQANTADMAAIQKRQSNIAAGLGMAGTALGAGAQLGAAGIAK